jgi:hypothetical protein
MIRTINRIAESIMASDSLFATLRGVHPVLDEAGRPRVKILSRIALFEVEHEARPRYLACSTVSDDHLRERFSRYERLSQGAPRMYLAAECYERELVLFDSEGRTELATVALIDRRAEGVESLGELLQSEAHAAVGFEPECEGVRYELHADGYHLFNHRGEELTHSPLLMAGPMREGRAEVETESGFGLIDKCGRYVMLPIYEQLAWDEVTGVCRAMRDGEWHMYGRMGEQLTDIAYDWIGEPSEGLFPMEVGGQSGYLDVSGREVIAAEWDNATGFDTACASVWRDGAVYIIDKQGYTLK